MTNKKAYTIIDTAGQKTAVVQNGFTRPQQPFIAKFMMTINPTIEQVAFLENGDTTYRCQMMGNELSINGSLAAAYLVAKSLKKTQVNIELSGLDATVTATTDKQTIFITFPSALVKRINQNIVLLNGITYQVVSGFPTTYLTTLNLKQNLQKLAKNVPAAGIIFYEGNTIRPLVYVKATNSYVWENACGSGSLAFFLVTGTDLVTQPSCEVITIAKNSDTLTISSPVKEIL